MPSVLVTGSTDGIGLETARQLLKNGWTVLVHGRNQKRAESCLPGLGGGKAAVPVWGDLAVMAEVCDLAAQCTKAAPDLTTLVLNAGVYETKRTLTGDGFEKTMAVNHFSHFLLVQRLQPALAAARQARVVWVASGVHKGAQLDTADLDLSRAWDPYGAYAASKLANVATAAEMARRPTFKGVLSVSLHPGVVGTKLLRVGFGMGGIPTSEGARTSVFCATEPGPLSRNGGYFKNSAPAEADARALDPAFGAALWEASLRRLEPFLCG